MSLRPGAVNFAEKWSGLQDTIRAVVELSRVNMATWNDNYSDIYALCEAFPQPYDKTLYQETEALLQGVLDELYKILSSLDYHSLLSSYQRNWLKYQHGAKFLNNLYSYFNRVSLKKYQPQNEATDYPLPGGGVIPTPQPPDTPLEIRNMALKVWKESVIVHLQEPLVKALLEEVQRARDGEPSNLSMVRDIVASFIEVEEYNKESSLKFYQALFEVPFLHETGQYYRQQASRLASEMTCSEYIHRVVAMLRTARERGQRFLHKTSLLKFVRECEACLVEEHLSDYLYSNIRSMVQQERQQDLSNLFVLLNGIPRALEPVIREFEEHVTSQGLMTLSKLQLDKSPNVGEFINAVLSIHRKFQTMVTDIFGTHKLFISALDRACRAFVNVSERPKQHPRAPLLLARYCDQLLRKSSKGLGEQEVDEKLDEAIIIFRYIDDKDLFQRFYSRMLSRRLIQGLSLSMEAEENMVQKLKHICGYDYTARLQKMVTDIKLSAESVTKFNDHLKSVGETLSISFSTLVLKSAAWPLVQSSCGLAIPEELAPAISKFEKFYTLKHSGRKLVWLHHLSLGELKIAYLKKPYTVGVTTYQMAILLAFNQSDLHTFTSLGQYTQLGDGELIVCLQSLVDCKLLGLSEQCEVVNRTCVVRLNKSYSNKRTKFKVTAALQKDTHQEVEQTQYSVQEDRKLHLQAAIVRVMKARKTLKHNRLIEETISQVKSRFTPNVQMLKRCIESLIEKQYLERTEQSKDCYNYVA